MPEGKIFSKGAIASSLHDPMARLATELSKCHFTSLSLRLPNIEGSPAPHPRRAPARIPAPIPARARQCCGAYFKQTRSSARRLNLLL